MVEGFRSSYGGDNFVADSPLQSLGYWREMLTSPDAWYWHCRLNYSPFIGQIRRLFKLQSQNDELWDLTLLTRRLSSNLMITVNVRWVCEAAPVLSDAPVD